MYTSGIYCVDTKLIKLRLFPKLQKSKVVLWFLLWACGGLSNRKQDPSINFQLFDSMTGLRRRVMHFQNQSPYGNAVEVWPICTSSEISFLYSNLTTRCLPKIQLLMGTFLDNMGKLPESINDNFSFHTLYGIYHNSYSTLIQLFKCLHKKHFTERSFKIVSFCPNCAENAECNENGLRETTEVEKKPLCYGFWDENLTCCVLMSTPDSQHPNPGWLWYQPTTISGLHFTILELTMSIQADHYCSFWSHFFKAKL